MTSKCGYNEMHHFFCITLISSQKLYNLFFYVKTEVTCSESFPSKKVVLLLIVYYIKLTAWKNKNALVLTLCTCSWGSWDSGKDVWLVWGHVNGGMERLLHLLLGPDCLSATSAHTPPLLPRVPSPWPRSPDVWAFLPSFFSLSSLPYVCAEMNGSCFTLLLT